MLKSIIIPKIGLAIGTDNGFPIWKNISILKVVGMNKSKDSKQIKIWPEECKYNIFAKQILEERTLMLETQCSEQK